MSLRFVSGAATQAALAGEQSIIDVCGTTLGITDAKTGIQTFSHKNEPAPVASLQQDARELRNITALCTGPKGTYAYSRPAERPAVVVRALDDKAESNFELANGAELAHAALAFARDGTRLAAVGAELSRELVIWDLRCPDKSILARKELHTDLDKVSFCPLDANYLACAGPGGLRLLNIAETSKSHELHESTCETLSQSPVSDFAWSKDGQLLVLTAQHILRVDPRSGQVIKQVENDCKAITIRAIKGFLLMGTEDGSLLWTSESTFAVIHSATPCVSGFVADPYDLSSPQTDEASALRSPIVALRLNDNFTKVLVITSRGDRFVVSTHIPTDGGNADFELISSAHADAVLAMAPVLTGPRGSPGLLASIGQDSSLRIWDATSDSRVPLAQTIIRDSAEELSTRRKLTSLASSTHAPFLAVGTKCGLVLVIQVSKPRSGPWRIQIVQTIRAHDHAIAQLVFSPCGNLLATISSAEAVMSTFRVNLPSRSKRDAIELATVTDLPDYFHPRGLVWQSSETILMAGQTVPDSDPDAQATDNVLLEASLQRVTLPSLSEINKTGTMRAIAEPAGTMPVPKHGAIGGMVRTPSGHILATLLHKPQEIEVLALSQGDQVQVSTLPAQAHEGPTWALTQQGQAIASGSLDGTVTLWLDAKDTAKMVKTSQAVYASSVMPSTLCFTSDTSVLAVGLADGAVAFVPIPRSLRDASLKDGTSVRAADDDKLQLVPQANIGTQSMSESAKWKKRAHDVLESEFEKKRSERRGHIKVLQERLFSLLEANKMVSDLEKLPREEFVVDVEGRKIICQSNEAAAEALRAEIEQEIADREDLYARIKQNCWEAMETPSREVRAVDAGEDNKVRNFPVPKQSAAEKRRVARVMQMRSIELREIRAAAGPETASKRNTWATESGPMRTISDEVDWIVNAGVLKPSLDDTGLDGPGGEGNGDAGAAEKAKTGDDAGSDDGADADAGDAGDDDDDDAEGDGEGDDADDDADEGGADGANGDAAEAAGANAGAMLIDLLYHPAALRSSVQVRHQLVMLRELQRKLMQAFNERFDKVVEEKEDAVERITSRYERINEILRELSREEEVVPNFWHPSERAESVLEVSQEEIGVEKYLSKAERERVAREEEERLRREAEAAKDNMGARALDDMMNGTLEAARELSLAEKTMERPAWMNEIDYADMSEEERKEHDDFEIQLAKFTEEKDKYIKSLEVEMKKIYGEIEEIAVVFGEVLKGLLRFKIRVAESIATQGQYISRLSLSLIRREDLVVRKAKNREALEQALEERARAQAEIDDFQPILDAARASLQMCQEKDKALEKNFKLQIQEQAAAAGDTIDADEMKILMAMFKYRVGQRATFLGEISRHSSRRSSVGFGHGTASSHRRRSSDLSDRRHSQRRGSHSSIGRNTNQQALAEALGAVAAEAVGTSNSETVETLDPYGVIDETSEEDKRREEEKRALVPLDFERDCPESLAMDEPRWALLQSSRLEKIRSELDLKRLSQEAAQLESQGSLLVGQRTAAASQIEALGEEFIELQESEKLESQDLEVIIRIKQGQDEVKAGALITSYADSMLLDRAVIEAENAEIVNLGDAKVGIMKKMKDFRKSINYMEWEHKYMLQQEYDLEEHYTDLHMLRVTRELQELIKGGEVTDTHEQSQQTEQKVARMKKIHQAKMDKMGEALDRIDSRERSLADENVELETRIRDLSTNVQMRNAVLQARTGISVLDNDHEATHGSNSGSNNADEETKDAAGSPSRRARASRPRKAQTPAVGSGASAAKARMKAIVTRRRLMDLARAQTDEIEFLKQELDRLRERNFPRFTHAASTMGALRNPAPPDAK
ncbi:Cilia- and flagella-associated protein 43 [Hondaea fermentalgiana]|uniref:Cilia- and flagella-associated protein 43 n=1 Tax=Hondaea fermentalgiana TaxID=2315210 RepID=A0A2R5GS38_9STRA|nr:Cilia- and flagella-associated protein 43 [Hondaea fermentalgiana]|eukprot:GBG33692.1 Cilia- and flagella-associated protein 43 [Hondaea fermentalgiana]